MGGTAIVIEPGPLDAAVARRWALQEFSEQSGAGAGVHSGLDQLCRAAAVGLGLRGAAVTLRTAESSAEGSTEGSAEGSAGLAVVTRGPTRPVIELEFDMGEGPSRDSFDRGRPVLLDDLTDPDADDYPAFAPAAVALDVRATFALPLHVGASKFGVLTLHSTTPRCLGRDDVSRCLALAQLATEMLLDDSAGGREDGATQQDESARIMPDLTIPLDLRSEIFQAQGMLMVALNIELSTALARLRAHAALSGRALIDVAVDLLEGRLELTNTATIPDTANQEYP